MTRRSLYRLAALLCLVMAIGHTVAFLDTSGLPAAARAARAALFDTRFPMLGADVSLGGFYLGFGWLVTFELLFAGVVAWTLGELTADAARSVRPIAWAFVVTMVATAGVAFAYLVVPPMLLALTCAGCVIAAERVAGA